MRKCKKHRTRQCIKPSVCGTKIVTELKPCMEGKCLKLKNREEKVDIFEEIVNLRNESSSDDFKILFHMPQLLSEWSSWTPCSKDCMTTRRQSCLIPEACGQKKYSETAICYTEGSECQEKYGSKKWKKYGTGAVGMDVLKLHPFNGFDCGVAPKASHSIDFSNKLRIIGGREALHGMWPWQVAILNRHREPFCGGTIISHNWILTAAHCERRRLIVRSGEHNLLNLENTEQESPVSRVFLHPEYNMNTVSNDIALLKLRRPFRFNNYTQAACLPEGDEKLEADIKAIILGWGKKKSSAIYGTDQLHQAEVPVVGLDECRQSYANYNISDKMLCAGYKQGRIDSCAGDSGGPLLIEKNNKWTVYGVTSFGDGCGEKGKFGIYSDVSKFVHWIKRTIARNS
ncbi:chymotrypsinogen B isoform X2 [Parasteatoda tepidariorum]|nr:chymotrypsinogen B isoform X2 [Parasteatoda tepidariorum]